jgi:hypothetical protein
MSKNISGPWKYKGILNEIAGNSNTNLKPLLNSKENGISCTIMEASNQREEVFTVRFASIICTTTKTEQ